MTHDPALIAKLDAAWGDPDAWVAGGLQWMHLDAVRAAAQARVSGDAGLDTIGWFLRHAALARPLPFARVLVLGCGTGRVERYLVGGGHAVQAVAIDLSTRALDEARRQARGLPGVQYLQADMNQLPVGEPGWLPGSFDAVFGVSSVHHCAGLDALYGALHGLLVPGGWLFLDEYVGPERFQYPAGHMRLANQVAALLPDRLVTMGNGMLRRDFRAPTVDEVVAVDPSEAVNSTRIIPALQGRFAIEAVRPYGGTLLEVLLSGIAQNFTGEDEAYLRAVIRAEDDAINQGTLAHHFACVIARQVPAGA